MNRTAALAAALLLALVLAGCGGNAEATPTPAPASATSPAAAEGSAWSRMSYAYVSRGSGVFGQAALDSFQAVKAAAQEVLDNPSAYTAEDVALAQKIYDAASKAYSGLNSGNTLDMQSGWEALDINMAPVLARAPPTPTVAPTPISREAAAAAVAFVRQNGTDKASREQIIAAIVGLVRTLKHWLDKSGGEMALSDCERMLPGIVQRATNDDLKRHLENLLAACKSGSALDMDRALMPFEELLANNGGE